MLDEQEKTKTTEKIHVTPQGCIALIIMLCMFSGMFKSIEGPLSFLRVLDINNLIGSFGSIAEGATFIGKGGTGARDGFLFALTLIPGMVFSMGLIEVFTKMGVMQAFQKTFTPILRPLLGIPGACGLAFVNAMNSSDVASNLTRDLYNDGYITDDERTVFIAYQYAGSAPIGNMIATQSALLPIALWAMGPMILLIIFCKLLGANMVRIILKMQKRKGA